METEDDGGVEVRPARLRWTGDRRKQFASASRRWPGFMTEPGDEMMADLVDTENWYWGRLSITFRDPQTFPPRDRLTWDVVFDFCDGQVRRHWSFDNIEAALHFWITYRDDFPIL